MTAQSHIFSEDKIASLEARTAQLKRDLVENVDHARWVRGKLEGTRAGISRAEETISFLKLEAKDGLRRFRILGSDQVHLAPSQYGTTNGHGSVADVQAAIAKLRAELASHGDPLARDFNRSLGTQRNAIRGRIAWFEGVAEEASWDAKHGLTIAIETAEAGKAACLARVRELSAELKHLSDLGFVA